MRRVDFVALGRSVSALGFGCASLGSRIDAKRGTEALVRAYEAGVSWFDVAPSYGDGHAEELLGTFLVGKRSQVTLCTKVGILPGRASLAARIVKPVAQHVLHLAPRLRKFAIKYRPPPLRMGMTGSFIESSIQGSLKRLQTDCVDVLALHEASLADVEREDVLRALDNVISRGYTRSISMAGDLNVALHAVALMERVSVIQVANSPFVPNVELAKQRLARGKLVSFVTHGVYGHDGSLDTLAEVIGKEKAKSALLKSHGYQGTPREMAADFLLDFALVSNPEGVVLLSMYQRSHLRSNLDRLTAAPPPQVVLALRNGLVPSSGK
jgi:aryl-alcohol dehydrogenase-like predicted oxidoreductase